MALLRKINAKALALDFIEGARCAVLMTPRWQYVDVAPFTLAALMAAGLAVHILLQRLYIVGPAEFYWQAIASGWFSTALLAWVCYAVRPQAPTEPMPHAAPGAAHLFTISLAQTIVISLACGSVFAVLIRSDLYSEKVFGHVGMEMLWWMPMAWGMLAQLVLLLRCGERKSSSMLAAILVLIGMTALLNTIQQPDFWYPEEKDTAAATMRFRLTQEAMEAQQPLLVQRLNEIKSQRPNRIDLYAIGFSPNAEEDVFRRESAKVTSVMAQRFDAKKRILQLVNHPETTEQWPWATPLNLRRAIKRMASIMDKKEDILFIHLTSHGARNGELAASFWPMEVERLKPADLKTWLDEAGIKHRVISISACYSGSWIVPLAGENTLIMTAADAEHTSYGCGRKSDLTFFGRAMYDEQLRTQTLSFEEAHQAARLVIKQREEEAGKSDGYSNPQISSGAGIKKQLAQLQAQLQQEKPH